MTAREQSVFCARAAARLEALEAFAAEHEAFAATQTQTNATLATATAAADAKIHEVDAGLAIWASAQEARVDGLRIRLLGWRIPRWLVRSA